MNRFWQMLLGIERSPGAVARGDSRLEFAAMPKGPGALVLILGAIVLLALIWRLYRWERRDLSRTKRIILVGLRGLTLLAVSIMLLEPVLVSSQRETIPSHLVMVLDDSESMKYSDPYTDDSKAVALASDLKLESQAGRTPVQRLRETSRLDLVKTVLRPN
ncbi:MAG: VWA domain-containing protein, partial [Isosphaeraceae bacterium]